MPKTVFREFVAGGNKHCPVWKWTFELSAEISKLRRFCLALKDEKWFHM